MRFLYMRLPLLLLSIAPLLGRGQAVDVTHLALDLRFDWAQQQAAGRATLSCQMRSVGASLRLDAGHLLIDAVTIGGAPLKYNYDGGDGDKNLEIMLDRAYAPGETIVLAIDYKTLHRNESDPLAISGSFGKGLRFQQGTSTTPMKRKQIWSSGEPRGNRYWFPCNDDMGDIHTTEVRATVEKPLQLISNGVLQSVTENGDHTRTYHYRADEPFPNYLVAIVVGEYAEVLQRHRAIPIRTYGYPHEMAATKATVALLPDMMKFIEDKVGYKFPFPSYSQVVVQDYPFPGLVGQQGTALLSDNYIDDKGVHEDFKYLWDGVAAQALANQWFGNLIMPATREDLWLNNAFAQYFAGLYTAKDNSPAEYLTYYHPFEVGNVLGDWDAGNRHPIVPQQVEDLPAFTTDSYSKFRGALVLRMLQREMGEKRWWKAVQLYVRSSAHQQVGTREFQAAIEATAGKSYQWFFDQWIFAIGLPEFEVTQTYDHARKQLQLTVRQVQDQENKTAYPQVEFFQGTVDIEIDGRVEAVYLKPQEENIFVFSQDKCPAFVQFNFEDNFLCKTTFDKSPAVYLAQLQQSRDVLARQQALDGLAVAALDSSASASLKAEILAAIKAEIRSDQHWRHRWYALGTLRKVAAFPYDAPTLQFIQETITREKSWIKGTAIGMLARTADPQHAGIYLAALHDGSDRVINAAAIALGTSKSPLAYDALMDLENRPSWKNQNRISALNGLEKLGDKRAVPYALACLQDNRSPRWYLATPTWDYPFAAANTLVALGETGTAYDGLMERLRQSLQDGDLNDIFQNVQLINLLKDRRATEMYALLRAKYKDNAPMLETIASYAQQWSDGLEF